jgi:hypothetical protein
LLAFKRATGSQLSRLIASTNHSFVYLANRPGEAKVVVKIVPPDESSARLPNEIARHRNF